MTFAEPQWLWALLVLPVLALLEWRAGVRAKRGLAALVGARPDSALLVQRRIGVRRVGALLRLAALGSLLLGAAEPEWGREVVRRTSTGSDVLLLLDCSVSMDARDVPPTRLSEARREALAVVDRLEGSRIGVVAFAGDAVRLCPLTLDRAAVRLVLESLSSGSVSEPGSDLGKGLRTAVRLLPKGKREEQAILVWTDGEDLERAAHGAIDELVQAGIRVFAVGVGTAAGDVIPVTDGSGHVVDVKRDEQGGAVRSRLDEGLLRDLARQTRGAYFSAMRPGGELQRLIAAMEQLARGKRGQRLVERPVSRFPLCAAVAALLLVVERGRSRRRGRVRRETAARAPAPCGATGTRALATPGRAAAATAMLVFALAVAGDAHAQSAWARGNRAFKDGRYPAADSLYGLRLARGGPDAVRVNRATARALAGHLDRAETELGRLATRTDALGHTAAYNIGTLLGDAKRYDEGLKALRQVLEHHPSDDDARWNYEVMLKRREEDRKRPPEQQNPKPQPQDQGGGGGGSPQPQPPAPPQPSPGAPPPGSPQPQSPSAAPPTQGMTRAQADRLLGALQEMARAEQQRKRKVQVMRETRKKDW